MTLSEYRKKREFSRTSEPQGGAGEPSCGFRFVTQKHRATHLHYDLRLEIDGVLKSWAVPKGPSLDTGDKRLAMQTEDHPVEYLGFEGVIPAGEYGAGPIICWDTGTFETDTDPSAQYAKGTIKFRLSGWKLSGGWTLVRTKGEGGTPTKQWLLIKERDAAARTGEKYAILSMCPQSVISGLRIEQVSPSTLPG